MRRLLFVPADRETSQALEQALRSGPETWDWHIASNVGTAREQLAKKEWDALVADLRSEPGHALLTEACETCPEVVRIGVLAQLTQKNPRISSVQQTISNLA